MSNRLYVVGIGPGDRKFMTGEALAALEDAQVIVGYTVYVELVKEFHQGREVLSTPMTKEEDRCRMALERAQGGQTVAMVCSGDSVVYGMAALLYDLGEAYPDVELRVVPGITAALSGGAVLGAPLTSDFAVISLSDLLTPWEKIEKRLRAAGEADFAICLYNPSSKRRAGYLRRACEILMESRPGETVCGYVKNIGRPGQESALTTLSALADTQVDMFTTVFIGSSDTRAVGGRMVTDRGYGKKR